MEKILLISASTSLENRLGDLVDSPRHVARVSSWAEARRLLTKTVPATVLVDSELVSDPLAGQGLVHLNNVLQKDEKPAYLLGDPADDTCSQWSQMFETISRVIPPPTSPGEWISLRDMLVEHLRKALDEDSSSSSTPPTESGDDSSTEVVVRLPRISSGSLSSLSISRIMYSLHRRQATGVLELHSGNVERRFGFRDGAFVPTGDHDDVRTLTGAYAWSDGRFEFIAHDHIPGSQSSIYPLIKKGLITHRSQRQLMDGLMPRLKTYPTCSNLCTERNDMVEWNVLRRFLDHCNGRQTLESIFSQMGNAVTDAFRAAAFCRDTDLVVFRSQPTDGPLRIQYEGVDSQPSPGASESSPEKNSTDAGELATLYSIINQQSPHEVFDVWKGCGREVVKETYYSMVKEYHPDVYGGNVSPQVRDYAQKIFVEIRNAYTKLLQIEDEQTVPPPDQSPPSRHRQAGGGRRKLTTLHPGQARNQSQNSHTQKPHRKRSSTPIAMGRTPTSEHPELKQQLGDESSSPQRASTTPGRERSPTPPPSMDSRPAQSKGLGDTNSDPEWRREQLERLQQKRKKPARRATPISTSKTNTTTSSDNPARDAFNLGYKKFKKHRYQDALSYLEKAHKLDPRHSLYTTFFAYCLFQTDAGRFREAIKLLKDVIRQEDRQSLPDAHLFMGHILKAKDREHQAYKHFKKAYKLNPASRDAERELRLYERRHGKDKDSKTSKSGGFFKKLFKD